MVELEGETDPLEVSLFFKMQIVQHVYLVKFVDWLISFLSKFICAKRLQWKSSERGRYHSQFAVTCLMEGKTIFVFKHLLLYLPLSFPHPILVVSRLKLISSCVLLVMKIGELMNWLLRIHGRDKSEELDSGSPSLLVTADLLGMLSVVSDCLTLLNCCWLNITMNIFWKTQVISRMGCFF